MSARPDRLWVIHLSKQPEVARRACEEGFVCIGWGSVGDLGPLDSRDKALAAFCRTYSDWSINRARSCSNQAFRFAHEIREDDWVVFPQKGAQRYHIGRFKGGYVWSSDPRLVGADCQHTRLVTWLTEAERPEWSEQAVASFGAASSLTNSDRHLPEVLKLLEQRPQ